jgi:hypothetical protein
MQLPSGWNGWLGLVEPVALRPVLPAQRALVTWLGLGTRTIPSPDASLGDGIGRSATNATKVSVSFVCGATVFFQFVPPPLRVRFFA